MPGTLCWGSLRKHQMQLWNLWTKHDSISLSIKTCVSLKNLGYEAGLMKTMPACQVSHVSVLEQRSLPLKRSGCPYLEVQHCSREIYIGTQYQLHYSVFVFFRECNRKFIHLSKTSFSSSMVHTIIRFPYLNQNNFLSLANFCWPLLLWCKLFIYSQILAFHFLGFATVHAQGQYLAPFNKGSLTWSQCDSLYVIYKTWRSSRLYQGVSLHMNTFFSASRI